MRFNMKIRKNTVSKLPSIIYFHSNLCMQEVIVLIKTPIFVFTYLLKMRLTRDRKFEIHTVQQLQEFCNDLLSTPWCRGSRSGPGKPRTTSFSVKSKPG